MEVDRIDERVEDRKRPHLTGIIDQTISCRHWQVIDGMRGRAETRRRHSTGTERRLQDTFDVQQDTNNNHQEIGAALV